MKPAPMSQIITSTTLPIFLLLLAIFLTISTTTLHADPCVDYEASPRLLGSAFSPEANFSGVAVDWPLLFVASYSGPIRVINAREPDNMVVHNISGVRGTGIWKQGNLGFTRRFIPGGGESDYRAVALNLSNPLAPAVLDSVDFNSYFFDIQFHGNLALVAADFDGLVVLDISDPDNILTVSTWNEERVYSIQIKNNLAYVGTYKGLFIFDLTNPEQLVLQGGIPGNRMIVHLDGDNMVTINGTVCDYFDISNPLHPVPTHSINGFYPDGKTCFQNGVLANARLSSRVDLYFPSETETHIKTGLVGQIGFLWGAMALTNDRIIRVTGEFVDVYDLNNGNLVQPISSLQEPLRLTDAQYKDGFALMATWEQGLKVLDLDDFSFLGSSSPQKEDFTMEGVRMMDDLALGYGLEAIWLYDATNPENLTEINYLTDFGWGIKDMEIQGTTAWLLTHDGTQVKAMDFSDPLDPQLLHSVDFGQLVHDISIDGNTIFAVGSESSLLVLPVPESGPGMLMEADLEANGYSIFVDNGLAAVTHSYWGHNSVSLLDITNPTEPELLSRIPLRGCRQSTLKGDLLYLQTTLGLHIYDIRDPANPAGVGTFWKANENHFVLPNGQALLWDGYNSSLALVPAPCGFTDPIQTVNLKAGSGLLKIGPNPFNPRTTIGFVLPRSGHCQLVLHDLHGRIVRSLFEGTRSGGPQQFLWNGFDDEGRAVPSGVYFARLVFDGGSEVRKMTLIR